MSVPGTVGRPCPLIEHAHAGPKPQRAWRHCHALGTPFGAWHRTTDAEGPRGPDLALVRERVLGTLPGRKKARQPPLIPPPTLDEREPSEEHKESEVPGVYDCERRQRRPGECSSDDRDDEERAVRQESAPQHSMRSVDLLGAADLERCVDPVDCRNCVIAFDHTAVPNGATDTASRRARRRPPYPTDARMPSAETQARTPHRERDHPNRERDADTYLDDPTQHGGVRR